MTTTAVARALLPTNADVDDAVLEYVCGSVDDALDEGQDEDDVIDAIAPLLDDCLSLDGGEINHLCRAIIRGAREARNGGGGPVASASATAADPATAADELSVPLKLNDGLKSMEAEISESLKEAIPVKVNFNSSMMSRGSNTLIDDESEEAMARRLKMEKRQAKLDRRGLRREKTRSMQRDETLQALTTEPVVLHWRKGRQGTSDIMLRDVSMQLGALELLSGASFTLVFGRRYGLIGRNGIGKTTLLKYLAAKRFGGIPAHLQVLHIEQEVPGGSASVLECVLATDAERAALLAEEAELQAEHEDDDDDEVAADRADRLREVWERLMEIDADSAPARAASILAGLGFDEAAQQRTTSSFSGGWRMRVALARALFISPDVLLLDE